MYRTRQRKMTSTTRKVVLGASALALAGGAFAVSTGMSSAGENCVGLDQALRQNLQFIAGQRSAPDAQSEARIANRQAVVDLINQRRAVAGCNADVAGEVPGAAAPAGNQATKPPAANPPAANPPAANPPAANPPAANPPAGDAGSGAGEVVCKGSTVTLSGEAGAPFASSGTFPIGTTLKVTNLDNNKSTTVKVETTSGSCILLNNAAFEQVREPGKFLIRRAVIERVG
ncbi:septal ring lytic transglycosylase RlpA family protein [Paractinoplanes hotanensis]|uniref:Septal ring lytic transglycosylase RlpA family protein n=1 Tax=Paractinoplanes hotanensis TaxID=2906497 RepID=A0ABT0XZS3_9ACTN|nr:septal ring lytic transglycosylase RlpA family protein [Actinoplanes hotanensis]MCM4078723.1 septal ring lytic transglycosylase RlpA family protein [Actinoplanes hotanensis]